MSRSPEGVHANTEGRNPAPAGIEDRHGALSVRVSELGFEISLYPMLFGNVRLCVGAAGASTYDRAWCYRDHAAPGAFEAAETWDGSGLPPGSWYRDLSTGETRDDGAPDS
ncbi:hypothetical protein [Miltoncostaea oceani]|uniref:hypothetical protein n=1 Tax=Miltoncostaea oceani TaxID=2843216 RepID=UPI001C3C7B0B|nr:hypothetical protein [Miltoncostaea oceani]